MHSQKYIYTLDELAIIDLLRVAANVGALKMLNLKSVIGSCLILSFATHASAQDAGLHLTQNSDSLDLQAGLRFSVPFGTAGSDRFEDRATIKFAVSATRTQSGFGHDDRDISSHDIFAIGFDETIQPRMVLSGQDISYSAFPNIYQANEDSDESWNERNEKAVAAAIILLVLGFGTMFAVDSDNILN